MKFLKTYKLFENNQEFEVGDFVKIVGDYFDIAHKSFFESNFGQISKIYDDTNYPYNIKFFKQVPLCNGSYIFYANLDELEAPNELDLNNYLKNLVKTKYLTEDEYKKILINMKSKKYNL